MPRTIVIQTPSGAALEIDFLKLEPLSINPDGFLVISDGHDSKLISDNGKPEALITLMNEISEKKNEFYEEEKKIKLNEDILQEAVSKAMAISADAIKTTAIEGLSSEVSSMLSIIKETARENDILRKTIAQSRDDVHALSSEVSELKREINSLKSDLFE